MNTSTFSGVGTIPHISEGIPYGGSCSGESLRVRSGRQCLCVSVWVVIVSGMQLTIV